MRFDYNKDIIVNIMEKNISIYFKSVGYNYLLVADGVGNYDKIEWLAMYPELREHAEKIEIIKFAEKIFLFRGMA